MLTVQAALGASAAPPLARPTRARHAAASRVCVAQAKPTPPSGSGGGAKKPAAPRGPGQAPLRMQTEDQRKFGYGGDNYDGGNGRGDGDRWEPGGSDDGANPLGLGVLVACGLWAYFEYKRPGGKLNPRTREQEREAYFAAQRSAQLGASRGSRRA